MAICREQPDRAGAFNRVIKYADGGLGVRETYSSFGCNFRQESPLRMLKMKPHDQKESKEKLPSKKKAAKRAKEVVSL